MSTYAVTLSSGIYYPRRKYRGITDTTVDKERVKLSVDEFKAQWDGGSGVLWPERMDIW